MKRLLAYCLLSIACCQLFGQKKPLDHSVYDSWQHIGERMISNDGKWVVYTIDPQEGDNELVIQSSSAVYKKTIARGYSAQITEDSRFVIFKIRPLFKDIREARIKKKKPEDFPKDSLAIVELGKENVWKTTKVKTFKTPQKTFGWLGYQLEKPVEIGTKPKTTGSDKRITDSLNRIIDSLNRVIESLHKQKKKKNKNKNKDDDGEDDLTHASRLTPHDLYFADGDETPSSVDSGSDLFLRNLETGEEKIFNNVLEYFFSKTGEKLLFEQAKNPKDSLSKPSVILFDLRTASSKVLSKGGNDFKNFALSDDGLQVAYVAERDAIPKAIGTKDPQKYYKLWHYSGEKDSATSVADRYTVGMPLGSTVSEFGTISFSKTGKRLFFGTAAITLPKDTSIIDIDMPKVDIWHYNDEYLQTVQNYPARLRAAQQENFLALYDLQNKTIQQLGNKQVTQVLPTDEGDGDTFVGVSDFGKRIESQWRGNTLKDIYAINVNTGDKILIKENLYGQVYPSSTGKYILWYERKVKNYFIWDGEKTRNITEKIKQPLWNEEFDSPDEPNNYGVMGWHENDSAVYLYDRYDVWKTNLTDNKPPIIINKSGRQDKVTHRNIVLNSEKRFFKTDDELLLKIFGENNKASGFALLHLGDLTYSQVKDNNTNPALTNYSIGPITASRGKKITEGAILYTRENFASSPDIYFSWLPLFVYDKYDMPKVLFALTRETKLSSINPQQANYLWGTAELFKWKAYNGKDATGIVYKPENFDSKKKYPMIVYFYEKLSQDLFDYKEPAPIRSAINVPFFVSRGYVIFMPDIVYTTGKPGQNAYDYIVSGSRALAKKGWVDSTRMALQGHSWGGYQAAQVATMTKLFKAVWAGAPVANMTSAYGGIRWESGVSRQFQYERTQSRIGGTLWDKLPLYIENSPLFHLDKVTAPMVIMANDADGAVPWYQGIELFTGLRRLGKKVWMFNYNGQGHGLTQRQDMRDYQIRMQQFFDWILKGEKPAKWITEGVPAVNKGREWGLE